MASILPSLPVEKLDPKMISRDPSVVGSFTLFLKPIQKHVVFFMFRKSPEFTGCFSFTQHPPIPPLGASNFGKNVHLALIQGPHCTGKRGKLLN